MINKDELMYKLDEVIKYLKNNNGYEYKLYNHGCRNNNVEADSNIVEYAEDIKEMVIQLLNENILEIIPEDLPF